MEKKRFHVVEQNDTVEDEFRQMTHAESFVANTNKMSEPESTSPFHRERTEARRNETRRRVMEWYTQALAERAAIDKAFARSIRVRLVLGLNKFLMRLGNRVSRYAGKLIAQREAAIAKAMEPRRKS